MIYLGEQIDAKEKFYQAVKCWVNKKLLGSYSSKNPDGYKCDMNNCEVCEINFHKYNAGEFTGFILEHLERIIKSRPSELLRIENELKQKWIEEGLGNEATFNSESKKLFVEKGYNGWFLDYAINYNLSEWLDQHTCAYCNKNYILVSRKKNGEKGINCQFDHWFDKANHPILALSFYNLIPSCSVCNSSLKSTSPFTTDTHLHPYMDKDISERYSFSYRFGDSDENEISIANEENLDIKTRRTLKDLSTKLVYKRHSSKELQDLIDLRSKYSSNYLKILTKDTFSEDLELTEDECYRLIFGIELDSENHHKRPFSKFKKDIISELLNNT